MSNITTNELLQLFPGARVTSDPTEPLTKIEGPGTHVVIDPNAPKHSLDAFMSIMGGRKRVQQIQASSNAPSANISPTVTSSTRESVSSSVTFSSPASTASIMQKAIPGKTTERSQNDEQLQKMREARIKALTKRAENKKPDSGKPTSTTLSSSSAVAQPETTVSRSSSSASLDASSSSSTMGSLIVHSFGADLHANGLPVSLKPDYSSTTRQNALRYKDQLYPITAIGSYEFFIDKSDKLIIRQKL